MRGLPQKQNARRAYKIRLCGHLRRYKKIVKKTYIIYSKFYLNLQIDLTDFEKENPMDELLIGIKSQGIQDHKSKINGHLKELGNQLNDEKIVQVSETYSFGMDAMQLHKERTYFAVPTYLENITRIN